VVVLRDTFFLGANSSDFSEILPIQWKPSSRLRESTSLISVATSVAAHLASVQVLQCLELSRPRVLTCPLSLWSRDSGVPAAGAAAWCGQFAAMSSMSISDWSRASARPGIAPSYSETETYSPLDSAPAANRSE